MGVGLTDYDGPALGTEGGTDGLGENVHAPQHPLPGVIAEDHVLRCVAPSEDCGGLEEASGAREGSARAKHVHVGGEEKGDDWER